MTDIFYPNELEPDDISTLETWQLLVAACHFGDTMGDCVDLNYGYSSRPEEIICHDGKYKVSLKGDIDLARPEKAMREYADFDWRQYARDKIREAVMGEEPYTLKESIDHLKKWRHHEVHGEAIVLTRHLKHVLGELDRLLALEDALLSARAYCGCDDCQEDFDELAEEAYELSEERRRK